MATIRKTTSKKKFFDDDQIITLYMNAVLESNHSPKNIFLFCKENGIEEADFYCHFSSFDHLKQEIWLKFFENAVDTIQKEESFAKYTDKNKLLTLYFTLFEILTLNRSYLLFSLKEHHEGFKNWKDLKLFRNHFKEFIVTIIEANPKEGFLKLEKFTKPVFSEGAWIQFLFILKFWLDDTSKSFEKTDMIIEKSVNTVVDLLDTKPLESVIDLGKFLWKEYKK
jgi:hypothetical protein